MKEKSIKILFVILFFISFSGITTIFITDSLICSSMKNIQDTSKINFKELPQISQKIAWDDDGSYVCNHSLDQEDSQICSDGVGGAIITWKDERNGFANVDIYAQRIDSDGIIQWEVNGTVICDESNKQLVPKICSDGAGGAFITWQDLRSGIDYDIYAQRIDSDGIVQWDVNGIAICTESSEQNSPQICSDGAGGAIIAWKDIRNGNYDIYAQHVDSEGIVLWEGNGKDICTEAFTQSTLQIISDGTGGAIIAWEDARSGLSYDIYTQNLDSNGIFRWENNGTAVCTADYNQGNSQICSDGAGGAIIAWEDYRNGLHYDIYTQHIDINGTIQWTNNGIALCTASDIQLYISIYSDGAGGAIFAWRDSRSGAPNNDIYAQRIDSGGTIQWTNNGKAICTADYSQSQPQICGNGAGGAIITWQDLRTNTYNDIYAQRIDVNGGIQWTLNGLPICMADYSQYNPQICGDGAGTVIIAWQDLRNGNFDIYAQKIENPPPTSNHPSDVITSNGGSETINWTLIDDFGSGNYRVLANNTDGDYYTWVDWTSWANNTALNVPINRTNPGYFNYTIQYYDDQHNFGVPDTVIVQILESEGGFEINGYSLIILLSCSFGLILILTKKLKHIGKA